MSIKINKVFVYGTLMTDMHNHRLIKPFIKHLETVESPRNLYNRTLQEIRTLSGIVEQAYIYYWANPNTIDQLGTQIKKQFEKITRYDKDRRGGEGNEPSMCEMYDERVC